MAIGKSSGWYSELGVSTDLVPVITFRAATTAVPAITTARAVGSIVGVAAAPAFANRHGDALDNAAVVVAGGIHAIIDGEVSANQVRAHGSVFARQRLVLADGVCLVFPVIHAHDAREARGRPKGLVKRLRPTAASAKTCL